MATCIPSILLVASRWGRFIWWCCFHELPQFFNKCAGFPHEGRQRYCDGFLSAICRACEMSSAYCNNNMSFTRMQKAKFSVEIVFEIVWVEFGRRLCVVRRGWTTRRAFSGGSHVVGRAPLFGGAVFSGRRWRGCIRVVSTAVRLVSRGMWGVHLLLHGLRCRGLSSLRSHSVRSCTRDRRTG